MDDFELIDGPGETKVALKLVAEKEKLAFGAEHTQNAMATIKVVKAEADERAPMQLSVVIDRSGSMERDAKLVTVKKTMDFFVDKGLQKEDTFSIVAYGSRVETMLKPTLMDADGRKKAKEAIASIELEGMTNLSGGLLAGIEHITSQATTPGITRAILLCTDGLANEGIQDAKGIVDAAKGAMAGQQMKIHTFAFGANHNAKMLQTIAEANDGAYFFVENTEAIPGAFGAALGSLSSTVAQNAKLTLSYDADVASVKVLSSYKKEVDTKAKTVTLSMGDLLSEDSKDIVFEVTLVKKAWVDEEPRDVLSATLHFFDVEAKKFRTAAGTLKVSRPETTPEHKINVELDANVQRIQLSEAMKQASERAESGQIADGRQLLEAAMVTAQNSASAEEPILRAMFKDVAANLEHFTDQARYNACAAAPMRALSGGYSQQQATLGGAAELYENATGAVYRSLAAADVLGVRPRDGEEEQGLRAPALKRQAASP